LNLVAHTLREALEPDGPARHSAFFLSDRDRLGLNPETVTTDVSEFQHLLRQAKRLAEGRQRSACLREAVALYRGELLAGLDCGQADARWLEGARVNQRLDCQLALR